MCLMINGYASIPEPGKENPAKPESETSAAIILSFVLIGLHSSECIILQTGQMICSHVSYAHGSYRLSTPFFCYSNWSKSKFKFSNRFKHHRSSARCSVTALPLHEQPWTSVKTTTYATIALGCQQRKDYDS